MPARYLSFSVGLATYSFELCDWALTWPKIPGLYAFVAYPGYAVPYIGETGNFATRMPNHDVWAFAQRHGATNVYAMPFYGPDKERLALERDLIRKYDPPCNVQHRPEPSFSPLEGLSGFGALAAGVDPTLNAYAPVLDSIIPGAMPLFPLAGIGAPSLNALASVLSPPAPDLFRNPLDGLGLSGALDWLSPPKR